MKSHWAFQNFINGVTSEDPEPKKRGSDKLPRARDIKPQEEKEEEKEEVKKEELPEKEEEEVEKVEEVEEVEEVKEAEQAKPKEDPNEW